jgi:ribosomal protein S17
MKIEKKAWPVLFQKIMEGVKTYDLRLADFECKEGDILVLKEWNPKTKQYTGRVLEKKVTFVGKTKDQKFWPEKEVEKYGFQIIAFK